MQNLIKQFIFAHYNIEVYFADIYSNTPYSVLL